MPGHDKILGLALPTQLECWDHGEHRIAYKHRFNYLYSVSRKLLFCLSDK